jgi:hypothetical protein
MDGFALQGEPNRRKRRWYMLNMTSPSTGPRDLSDSDLLTELERAVASERHATARLIALLMEVDSRKLHAGQGYSSLFTYCVQRLHLSEHAAYLRIEAARLARRFPMILDRLSDGSLHLTAVTLLGPHLTAANHLELLESARHLSKREVEVLIARVRPQPDVPSIVRKLPVVPQVHVPAVAAPVAPRPPEIKPLASERYKVQCTVSRETYDKLRAVQDLLRHTIPNGDLSAILDRALTLLLADLSRTKFASTDRPRGGGTSSSRTRHISAAVKRDVWARDGGRCAFQGEQGRCGETGFLEFHHVVPYADGGETALDNLELRCRAHNQYEADLWSGTSRAPVAREARGVFST